MTGRFHLMRSQCSSKKSEELLAINTVLLHKNRHSTCLSSGAICAMS